METKKELQFVVYSADLTTELDVNFAEGGIKAGFPSPAQDYITDSIDLNKDLIQHPATTFYARAVGDSMVGEGIDDGDLLIIDKSLEPQDGNIVVAFIDGEFTLKRYHRDETDGCVWLIPANMDYEPIKVTDDADLMIWGVLTYNIKSHLKHKV